MTFRHFRDTFMQGSEEMRSEVQEYYKIAPQICASIERLEDKGAKVYQSIWEDQLRPALRRFKAVISKKRMIFIEKWCLN
jgi:hypothetical protein